jgi:vacuolar-type H+-ATPase subunit I/STV1
VNPLAIVKLFVAALLVVTLFLGGRSCGKQASTETINQKNAALVAASQQLTNAAVALREVNAKAAAARAEEKAQKQRADAAVAGAQDDAKAYDKRIDSIAVELEKAKRQPSCRAQLEAQLCAPLH